jgi:hypothetical protein
LKPAYLFLLLFTVSCPVSVMHSLITSGITRLNRAYQTTRFTAACRINSGFLWFGTKDGLTVLMVIPLKFSGTIPK